VGGLPALRSKRMAREFAKQFYHSMAWRRCRDAYITSRAAIDGGMCELCGDHLGEEVHHKIFLRPENIDDVDVTLNPDNLMFLCSDCHKREHEAARKIAVLNAKAKAFKSPILHNGFYYTEDGLVKPFKAHIVYGAPGAGKTTYVRKHKQPDDVVIDLDLIGRALCMADKTDVPRNIERIAYDIRDLLYQSIKDKMLDCREAWVVAGLPKQRQREDLAKTLDADLIFIDAPFRECYQHALRDKERHDKALQLAIIEKWFRDYEPDNKF
jgi:predicted kinase